MRMKQTVEEVAREAAEVCYECHYDDSLEMRLVKEAFIYGAEWQSKQSPWISVEDKLPSLNQKVIVYNGKQIYISHRTEKDYAKDADLIIYVIDSSRPLDNNDYEIMDLIMNKKVLVLLNKSDMEQVVTKEDVLKHLSCNVISVSAKEETGIDKLESEIKDMFFNGNISTNEEIYITNLRHKNLLREALESLKLVKEGIDSNMSEDFLTIDLMNAYEKLGLIIGEEVEDDLADRIFEKFCMGK